MSVSAGDTVRWVLGDTVSGTGTEAQAHILIKPTQAGLKTNLIITTSLRAYHLELRAFAETYMAAVSWRYADQQLVTRVARSGTTSAPASPAGLQLDRLKFRYDLDGDFPHWRPDRVFDDGRKVYIQFPARLPQRISQNQCLWSVFRPLWRISLGLSGHPKLLQREPISVRCGDFRSYQKLLLRAPASFHRMTGSAALVNHRYLFRQATGARP